MAMILMLWRVWLFIIEAVARGCYRDKELPLLAPFNLQGSCCSFSLLFLNLSILGEAGLLFSHFYYSPLQH